MHFIGETLPGMHKVLDSTYTMKKEYRVSYILQMFCQNCPLSVLITGLSAPETVLS